MTIRNRLNRLERAAAQQHDPITQITYWTIAEHDRFMATGQRPARADLHIAPAPPVVLLWGDLPMVFLAADVREL